MRAVELIRKKRQGEALTDDEIRALVQGYTNGTVPDYQMAAFAMAVFFRGMTDAETVALTDAMMHSGDTVDLSMFGDMSVDKHSTGGVGDKTSLVIAPIVACLGGKMAKMTGRGLGHTGGTVDKLESIPGFQITMSPEAFLQQVEEIGVALIGQSGNLTPADKKLYALRDVTATVDSLPLIASSIMSKKLAAGARSIVLDVKIGSGAFLKTLAEGKTLAKQMAAIGRACGRNVTCILTNMDVPLGYHVGNSLEVMEAVNVLKGEGPEDLTKICLVLASNLVSMCRRITVQEAEKLVQEAIDTGRAYETMKTWIRAQGGNAEALDDYTLLPLSPVRYEVKSLQDGYIRSMDAQLVGEASAVLGAGRATKEDTIDYGAGIVLQKKTGEYVHAGETLAVLYTSRRASIEPSEALLLSCYTWGDTAPREESLILDVVR